MFTGKEKDRMVASILKKHPEYNEELIRSSFDRVAKEFYQVSDIFHRFLNDLDIDIAIDINAGIYGINTCSYLTRMVKLLPELGEIISTWFSLRVLFEITMDQHKSNMKSN